MRDNKNTSFICENCFNQITPLTNGSFRNHCPYCLYSKHLDIVPGDRLNSCHGLMKPVALRYSAKKGYQIVHQCTICNHTQFNKIAVDCEQEDDMDLYNQLPFQ